MTERQAPEKTRQQRSTPMLVLGLLLLVLGAVVAAYGAGDGPGGLILGLLGGGLLIAGLVIRR